MQTQIKNEIYQRSWAYENLVTLCRQQGWGEHDAKNTDMENLMLFEIGASQVQHLKGCKLLSKVKKEMNNALKFALGRQLPDSVKNVLRKLIPEIGKANCSDELLAFCEKGISSLVPYKEMKLP